MRLTDLAGGAAPVLLSRISADVPLATDIQNRLAAFGLLDPPSDGRFGQVSGWALRAFLERAGQASATQLDSALAKQLLGENTLFPLTPGADLAGRLVSRMQAAGHWIARHPDCLNIVYAEGMNPQGTLNANAANVYNDSRFLIRVGADGVPVIVGGWIATTEPGKKYALDPALRNPGGAAHITLGQHKAWVVGVHNASKPSAHEALVQAQPLRITRDRNNDLRRDGDPGDLGMFGINQHHGWSRTDDDIGVDSAGCLVCRSQSGHAEFMKLVKTDARYKVSQGYTFMTSVLDGRTV